MKRTIVKDADISDIQWGECPKCEYQLIEGDNIYIEGNWAIQPMSCPKCHHEWEEHYQATLQVWVEER